MTNVYVTIVLG